MAHRGSAALVRLLLNGGGAHEQANYQGGDDGDDDVPIIVCTGAMSVSMSRAAATALASRRSQNQQRRVDVVTDAHGRFAVFEVPIGDASVVAVVVPAPAGVAERPIWAHRAAQAAAATIRAGVGKGGVAATIKTRKKDISVALERIIAAAVQPAVLATTTECAVVSDAPTLHTLKEIRLPETPPEEANLQDPTPAWAVVAAARPRPTQPQRAQPPAPSPPQHQPVLEAPPTHAVAPPNQSFGSFDDGAGFASFGDNADAGGFGFDFGGGAPPPDTQAAPLGGALPPAPDAGGFGFGFGEREPQIRVPPPSPMSAVPPMSSYEDPSAPPSIGYQKPGDHGVVEHHRARVRGARVEAYGVLGEMIGSVGLTLILPSSSGLSAGVCMRIAGAAGAPAGLPGGGAAQIPADATGVCSGRYVHRASFRERPVHASLHALTPPSAQGIAVVCLVVRYEPGWPNPQDAEDVNISISIPSQATARMIAASPGGGEMADGSTLTWRGHRLAPARELRFRVRLSGLGAKEVACMAAARVVVPEQVIGSATTPCGYNINVGGLACASSWDAKLECAI